MPTFSEAAEHLIQRGRVPFPTEMELIAKGATGDLEEAVRVLTEKGADALPWLLPLLQNSASLNRARLDRHQARGGR